MTGAGLRVVSDDHAPEQHSFLHDDALDGEAPRGPWRAHIRLDFLNPEVVVHRSLKRELVQRLHGLNPLAYDRDDSIFLSFVLPEQGQTGREFAERKIAQITEMLPPTRLAEFDLFQGQLEEPLTSPIE